VIPFARAELAVLVCVTGAGWLLAGWIGLVLAGMGALVGLRWHRLVAAYAAATVAAAGIAGLIEAPLPSEPRAIATFVQDRPVAGTIGLAAGLLALAAVATGISLERSGEVGSNPAPVLRSRSARRGAAAALAPAAAVVLAAGTWPVLGVSLLLAAVSLLLRRPS
jgi:hypothetical protein